MSTRLCAWMRLAVRGESSRGCSVQSPPRTFNAKGRKSPCSIRPFWPVAMTRAARRLLAFVRVHEAERAADGRRAALGRIEAEATENTLDAADDRAAEASAGAGARVRYRAAAPDAEREGDAA